MQYFHCSYAKRSRKKHKNYEDGVLILYKNKYVITDLEGKQVLKLVDHTIQDLKPEETLELSSKEVVVGERISPKDFASGVIYSSQPVVVPFVQKRVRKKTKQFKSHMKDGVPDKPKKRIIKAPPNSFILNERKCMEYGKSEYLLILILSFCNIQNRLHQRCLCGQFFD